MSWFGYRAPALPEVPAQGRAAAGGAELASFLDGIHDSRGGAPRRLTVLGHSYGSTTAAEALAQTRHRVDTFVTYGSVGFTDATKPEHLNVDRVYATEGQADHTAIKGRIGRTDPRDLPDVEVFSSEAADGLEAVTGHDMYPETAGQVGYLSPGSTAGTPSRRSSQREGEDDDHAIDPRPRRNHRLRLAPVRVHGGRRPHARRRRRSDAGGRRTDVAPRGVRSVPRALRADAAGTRGRAASGARPRVAVERWRPRAVGWRKREQRGAVGGFHHRQQLRDGHDARLVLSRRRQRPS